MFDYSWSAVYNISVLKIVDGLLFYLRMASVCFYFFAIPAQENRNDAESRLIILSKTTSRKGKYSQQITAPKLWS